MTVPHRDEYSDTLAFKIHGPNRTVLFVPDVDRFDAAPGLLDRLLDGVDVAYLDATFYDGRELPGRDLREIPHPPMTDTMERLAQRARRHPGSLRFLHLNHTNPALHDADLRADVERRGFRIAEPGERIPL
jgi:pyrroloquinoline quinone biosynthesis protein B